MSERSHGETTTNRQSTGGESAASRCPHHRGGTTPRAAQAVLLPALVSATLEQTATILGVGRATVPRLQQRHIWDDLREKEFPNRVFNHLDAVIAQLRTGLPRLPEDHERVRSLTAWPWIEPRDYAQFDRARLVVPTWMWFSSRESKAQPILRSITFAPPQPLIDKRASLLV